MLKPMLQSKIWIKIKKPLIVGALLSLSITFSFLSVHLSEGKAESIFSEILSSFAVLTIFTTTLSVALFNYIDGISKDVSGIDADHHKIQIALSGLSALKKEVIINAGLMISLLIIDLAIKGIAKSIPESNVPFENFYWVVVSVRFGIFTLAILAASEQIRGLLVAIEYRNVIHAGKSSNK